MLKYICTHTMSHLYLHANRIYRIKPIARRTDRVLIVCGDGGSRLSTWPSPFLYLILLGL